MESNGISDRDLRVIGHLQDSWQMLRDITPDTIAHIAKFIAGLSEPYKTLAIKIVADRINNTMSLHFLTLLATFEENALQEGIPPEDCQETLVDALPETFRIIGQLTTYISIQSLDELTILCNIAGSLRTLSRASSAEEAEHWIDFLPALYYGKLKELKYLSKDFLDWTQQLDNPVAVPSIMIAANEVGYLLLSVSLQLESVKLAA